MDPKSHNQSQKCRLMTMKLFVHIQRQCAQVQLLTYLQHTSKYFRQNAALYLLSVLVSQESSPIVTWAFAAEAMTSNKAAEQQWTWRMHNVYCQRLNGAVKVRIPPICCILHATTDKPPSVFLMVIAVTPATIISFSQRSTKWIEYQVCRTSLFSRGASWLQCNLVGVLGEDLKLTLAKQLW